MATHPDVLVVGGGIIGLTSALFLAKAGLSVEVVDGGEFGREASWAGAGIVPPGNPDRAATPFDRLRGYSTSQFPDFSEMLREETGIENGFHICGGIEFLSPDEQDAVPMWHAEGIPFTQPDETDIRWLEPNLQPPALPAYHLPGVGQVRNPWHVRALIAACVRAGVTLLPGWPVCLIGWNTSEAKVRYTPAMFTPDGDVLTAGRFLLSTGAWTGELTRTTFGLDLGVRPVRGQMVLFNPGRRLLNCVITVGKRYLVPRADGRILAGSTEEPEAGFDKANTPEGVAGLVRFARELVPTLANLEPETAWAGLRPGSPDGMPFLGPVPGYDNVFAAVGHFRAGIQLSIGTAEVMTALMTGKPPPVPVEAFRLDRPPAPPGRFAFRS